MIVGGSGGWGAKLLFVKPELVVVRMRYCCRRWTPYSQDKHNKGTALESSHEGTGGAQRSVWLCSSCVRLYGYRRLVRTLYYTVSCAS